MAHNSGSDNGMKWLTCTPLEFSGGEDFFCRDSGLLSRGFRSIGIESAAVMPGKRRADDSVELIRTDYHNLESPEWWRSQQGDGVVLYAWGMGKYAAIAEAIKKAGMTLVSSIDSSGLISPYRHSRDYIRLNYSKKVSDQGWLPGGLMAAAAIGKNLIPALLDLPRLRHLAHADLVAMVTPQGADTMKSLALRFGYPAVAEKTCHLPHPQLEIFDYDGSAKEKIILSVGRWDPSAWFQKNPDLLVAASGRFLTRRGDYRHIIVGGGVEHLRPLIGKHCKDVADRIELIAHVPPDELKRMYCKARTCFWSSRHEGQQNAGAQALCCGSSVVATTGMAVNCFDYYSSRESGTQASRNHPHELAAALLTEADAWDAGNRDPAKISSNWVAEFHAGRVARRVIDLTTSGPNPE